MMVYQKVLTEDPYYMFGHKAGIKKRINPYEHRHGLDDY